MKTKAGFVLSTVRLPSGKFLRIEWAWQNTDVEIPSGAVRIEVTPPDNGPRAEQIVIASFAPSRQQQINVGGLTGRIFREERFAGEPRLMVELVDSADSKPVGAISFLTRFHWAEGGSTNTLLPDGYYSISPFSLGGAFFEEADHTQLCLGQADSKMFQGRLNASV